MKKYTLTNYAGSGSPTSSDLLTSSGVVDSGVVISGMVASGVVNPDDDGTWDYGTYTEEEMEEMMNSGTWKGGYVNGVYVMPELAVIGNGGSSTGGPGAGGSGTSGPGAGGSGTGGPGDGDSGNGGPGNDGSGNDNGNGNSGGHNGNHDGGDNSNSGGGGTGAEPWPDEGGNGQSQVSPSNDSLDRYDVIDKSGFISQSGAKDCRLTCQKMQIKAGYTSSNSQFIPMTVNKNDKPIAIHERFQEGKAYIDSELARGRAVIVGVDYKATPTGNLDHGSDHFVLIVGKYPGIGSAYYHYFDPRTKFVEKGTRSENVLLIENGYLVGDFVDYPGKVYHYVVTRVNYNEDL